MEDRGILQIDQQNYSFQRKNSYASSNNGAKSPSLDSFLLESDDTTTTATASETNSNLSKNKKKISTKRSIVKTTLTATTTTATTGISSSKINNNVTDNPVENIRKQFEKLEDLGDQLPSNEMAYTLPYPFQDKCTHFLFIRFDKIVFFLTKILN